MNRQSSPLPSRINRLPAGMRDLLQDEARQERRVAAQISSEFSIFGYEEVRLPAFEYLDVVSRGLGKIDPEGLVRFVEPETGEVVALRPDMTPQVARLVASRWPDAPCPLRLSYHGSILRRQEARARNDFQVLQAGIELVGAGGSAADCEVISACVAALQAVGLREFVLDVGHGGVAGALLGQIPAEAQSRLLQHLAHKDQIEVEKALRGLGLEREVARAITALPELQGGREVLARARAMAGFACARLHLEALGEVLERLTQAGLESKLVVDLGETSPTPYYTGVMFQVLAEGPGQAVASGGRYDELYSRFGIEREAAGAAINIDHLRWALGPKGERGASRLLVVASDQGAGQVELEAGRAEQERVAHELRAARRAAVVYQAVVYQGDPVVRAREATATQGEGVAARGVFASAVEYARLANFTHVVQVSAHPSVGQAGGQMGLFRIGPNSVHELSVRSVEDLLALVPGSV